MHRTRLFWKLYITYLLAVVLCAGVVGWLAVGSASDLYHQQAVHDLKARAELVSSQVAPLLERPVELQALVKTLGATADTRLTVIAGRTAASASKATCWPIPKPTRRPCKTTTRRRVPRCRPP